ncbi:MULTISPECIES: MFS transporter [unclassified Cytobacillus]|uniref:MFS transporter n=1 Tax=unclassified Cytobacillus TaxID=2675268 RepID=UPI00203E3A05|nr:MFS transporter [Cytobacillus sp. AMY 15.2]MCM3093051.1 MFS transporter [Cytobacillus sp. AMY 15.2]
MKIVLIVCISGIYMSMIMGTRPTVSLFAHDMGAGINTIGLITSLFSLFPLLFAILLGRLIDQLNSKKTLLAGGYLGIIGILLPGLFPNFFGLIVSQLIAGSAQTIFILAAQDYVGRISTKRNRNQYVSWFSFGVAIGTLIGPLLSGILSDYFRFSITFYAMAFIGFMGCILVHFVPNQEPATLKKGEKAPENGRQSFVDLLNIPGLRLALLFSTLILFSKDLYLTFFPILGVQFGYSHLTIGFLLSINGIASVIIRFYLNPLTNRYGTVSVFIGSMFVTCVSYVALPFFPQIIIAGIIAFILGIGLGIGQPLSISLTIQNALNGRVAEALGIRLTVNRLTQVFTPIFLGALANIIGLINIFIVSSAVIALGTGIAHNKRNKATVTGTKQKPM